MSARIERRTSQEQGVKCIQSLVDMLHEGFYLLHLLKQGCAPGELDDFQLRVIRMLDDFEREARRLRAHGDDIEAAKYAYCAALDEIVLSSRFNLRGAWERTPLQLAVFGDQLAGHHFFERLEALRGKGAVRLQALQVFHMCLLLGFRGKFALHERDRLAWITARLGDEIAHIQGKRHGFAPQAERPDQVTHKLRRDVPAWLLCGVFGVAAAGAYGGLRYALERHTQASIAGHMALVKMPQMQPPPRLTITLP